LRSGGDLGLVLKSSGHEASEISNERGEATPSPYHRRVDYLECFTLPDNIVFIFYSVIDIGKYE
jgi:hypothetical protein